MTPLVEDSGSQDAHLNEDNREMAAEDEAAHTRDHLNAATAAAQHSSSLTLLQLFVLLFGPWIKKKLGFSEPQEVFVHALTVSICAGRDHMMHQSPFGC